MGKQKNKKNNNSLEILRHNEDGLDEIVNLKFIQASAFWDPETTSSLIESQVIAL